MAPFVTKDDSLNVFSFGFCAPLLFVAIKSAKFFIIPLLFINALCRSRNLGGITLPSGTFVYSLIIDCASVANAPSSSTSFANLSNNLPCFEKLFTYPRHKVLIFSPIGSIPCLIAVYLDERFFLLDVNDFPMADSTPGGLASNDTSIPLACFANLKSC